MNNLARQFFQLWYPYCQGVNYNKLNLDYANEMLDRSLESIPVNDYLDGEQTSQMRHEYINGKVYAMVGASDVHGLIAGNFFAILHNHLRGKPCQVFIADMKVRIKTDRDTIFYYPDVLVSCMQEDRERYYRTQPCLIVEILSEATERLDRGEKLSAYKQIQELQEYVLVAQRSPLIEIYRRSLDWECITYGPDDTIQLDSIDLNIPIQAVYEEIFRNKED